MAFHCELTGLDIHVINTWTYANSAARDAATGFTSDDVYKVAVQTDNNSVWILIDHSPITWQALGGVVVSEISHCDLDNLLVDCHTQYMPTDASRAFSQPVCGAPPTIGAHLTTKAYVDGEIVTDHGALNGLLDVEDHPGYSTIDGSRAYTAPVSGEDPTLDNHLATKLYTDSASANALEQANLYSDEVSAAAQEFENQTLKMRTDEREPTGFPNRTDSTLTFDNGLQTLTISGGEWDFYIKGVRHSVTGSLSAAIPDIEGLHFFYLDTNGVLQTTTSLTSTIFFDNALVSAVYWDADNDIVVYFGDERHGMTMDGVTHKYLHDVFGAQWESGLSLTNFDVDGSGNDKTAAQFSCTDGEIHDEDIEFEIENNNLQTLSPTGYFPVYYLDGASADWRKDTANAYPVKPAAGGSNRLAWNEYTGGAWQQTEVGTNNYVLCHIFASNDIDEPVIAIQGQAEYNSLGDARAGATTEINSLVQGAMPFAEFTPLGTVIYQTVTAYTNPVKGRVRSTDEGDDYIDFRGSVITGAGASVSDHGNLAGLADDDHTQYHTDARGDARYYTQAQVDTLSDAASANAYQQAQNVDIDDFLSLTDTPSAYTGDGLKVVRVNVGEDGLEFVTGAGSTIDIEDEGTPIGSFDTLDFVGDVVATDGGGGTATITVSGAISKYVATISVWNPSGGIYYADVVHNLGTKDLVIDVYTTDDDKRIGFEEIVRLDDDTVRVWSETNNQNVRIVIISSNVGTVSPGISGTFIELDDTPSSYSGQAYNIVRVKLGEDGVEFASSEELLLPTSDLTVVGKTITVTVDTNGTGFGAALYMASDGHFDEADADSTTTMPCRVLAAESGIGSKIVLLQGFIRDDSWNWTPGGDLYISTTTGALTHTTPLGETDQVQKIGFAWSADIVYFTPGDYTIVEVD